jgi:hypothetical protein
MAMVVPSDGIIAADPAELAAAAARVRSAVAAVELAVGALGAEWWGAASGPPRLGTAVGTFLRAWDDEVESAVAGARRVADALDLTAAAYRDVEVAAASPFARLLAWMLR